MKTLSAYVSDGVRRLPGPHAAFGVSLVAYKTVADLASKTVTLVVTVAAARALSAEDFGVMALAMTTGWLLGVASDAGLPMFAATRIAQANAVGSGTYPIAREVARVRLALSLAATVCALAVAVVLIPGGSVVAFMLIVLHQLFGAMLDTVAHVYRGLGRTDIESTISLAHRGAIALAALTILAVHPTLLGLAITMAVPPVLALIASGAIVRRVAPDGPSFRMTPGVFTREVVPLGLGVLLSALYFRIDVFFLERFHGIEAVGFYNAAFRIVDALRLFPAAVLAVAYPILCGATDLRALQWLSLGLVTGSVLAAAAVYVAATPLLALIYGAPFAPVGATLQVLSFSVPLFFLNYALTHQLIAWGRQRSYLAIAAIALVTNVTLNLLLIPDWHMAGAAYATLATEIVVCGGCLSVLRTR